MIYAPLMIILRLLWTFVGIGAIAWGTSVLPVLSQDSSLQDVASRIIAGDVFTTEVLQRIAIPANGQVNCRSGAARSIAIIRLRLMEEAMANGERTQIDASQ